MVKSQILYIVALSSAIFSSTTGFHHLSQAVISNVHSRGRILEDIFKQKLIHQHDLGIDFIQKRYVRLQSKLDSNDDRENEWKLSWLDLAQLHRLSKEISVSVDDIRTQHVDVTYYDQSTSTSYFHIRRSTINAYNIAQEMLVQMEAATKCNFEQVHDAATKTFNWCSDFVQDLNLCPWAKQSLLSSNAIRIKIIHETNGWDHMEEIVRKSSFELKALTDEGIVDPYIGITFVVAIPTHEKDYHGEGKVTNVENNDDFEFLTFYDYFNELEEAFMDDDDERYSALDEVTIAPFHPEWTFAPPAEDHNGMSFHDEDNNIDLSKDPLDYEKRTPYPTISIVMAKGIDLAGEEATAKIGIHNEEKLNELGYESVERLYHEKVLKNGSSRFFD